MRFEHMSMISATRLYDPSIGYVLLYPHRTVIIEDFVAHTAVTKVIVNGQHEPPGRKRLKYRHDRPHDAQSHQDAYYEAAGQSDACIAKVILEWPTLRDVKSKLRFCFKLCRGRQVMFERTERWHQLQRLHRPCS